MRAAVVLLLLSLHAAGAELWAVCVGVETYRHPELSPVPYAAADARAVWTTLTSEGVAAVPADRAELLTAEPDGDADRAPTRAAVLLAIKRLGLRAGPDDLLVVFFAGHGIETEQGQFLLTADSDPLLLEETGLALGTLRAVLDETRAGAVLLCIDACRNDPHLARSVGDNPLSEGLARGLRPKLAPRAERPRPVASLLACDVGQRAWAWPELGGGVFTRCVTDALRGAAAGDDGRVELAELADYVTREVPLEAAARGREQQPRFANDDGAAATLAVPKPIARLRLHSEPGGAAVTVDGSPRGRTPCDVELDLADAVRGEVQVVIEKPGYLPAVQRVEAVRGETVTVRAHLRHEAGDPPPVESAGPGFLGVELRDVSAAGADDRRRWPWLASLESGAMVVSVIPRGPAEGRLLPGDVVLSCDGERTATAEVLGELIRARRAGDTVRLLIRDGNGSRPVLVTLDPAPAPIGIQIQHD